MGLDGLREKLKSGTSGRLMFDEPLNRHTSWKVGGPADILFLPVSVEDLGRAVSYAYSEGLPVTVLGNGTNVLVSDKGVRGLVVKLDNIKHLVVEGTAITAGAGIGLPELSATALQHNLSGLEFAVGIPGSLGGAIAGNAGAHGSCMADIVEFVLVMDCQGVTRGISGSEFGFGYRSSCIKDSGLIVLEARLRLLHGLGYEIKSRMEHYSLMRRQTQPVGCATAGSVFVNPCEAPAGYLIERAGLKGEREGGAQVSEKHANFIVNVDRATADDIMRLIKRIQEKVFTEFGIVLKTEIRLVGEVP